MARPAHDVFVARRAAGLGRVALSRLLTSVPDDTIARVERSIEALPDLARANELIALLPTLSYASQKALQALVADADRLNWRLILTGAAANYASTPDTAAVSVLGDLTLRARVAPGDWTPGAEQSLIGKWTTTGNQRSYEMTIKTTGRIGLRVSDDGIASPVDINSTAAPGFIDGAGRWVQAYIDIDNGALGNTATFATSIDGVTWTPLGSPVITAGALATIFNGTGPVEVGGVVAGTVRSFTGAVYRAEVRTGDAGPIVASFSPQDMLNRVTAVRTPATQTAPTGEVWTVNGAAWSWAEEF